MRHRLLVLGGVLLMAGQNACTSRGADALPDLHDGWNAIAGGGETVCSDGSPYRFFVRPASREKLLIYFQGGGGCWSGETCDTHLEPTYDPTVDENELDRYQGIFDFDHPDNPFTDYSMVVAPYCTGDVHLGDNTARYDAPAAPDHASHPLDIHHRGMVNAAAVLAWTYGHFDPQQVFVTGSSAGAIPSPYYAWQVADRYPRARVAQLGDGAGGYRRSQPDPSGRLASWNVLGNLSGYPEFAAMGDDAFNYEQLYIAAARRHPEILFAEYDAAEDAVQKRYLALSGNDTATLKDSLLANHADIRREVDNFRAYVAGGDSHTVLGRPEFYTFQVDGVRIRDWVADLAAFRRVEDVVCERCDVAETADDAEPPSS